MEEVVCKEIVTAGEKIEEKEKLELYSPSLSLYDVEYVTEFWLNEIISVLSPLPLSKKVCVPKAGKIVLSLLNKLVKLILYLTFSFFSWVVPPCREFLNCVGKILALSD